MANSYIEVSTSGSSYVLPASFNYLDINDINALGKESNGTFTVLTVSSRDTINRTIVLSGTPSQSTVRFYRATTQDPLVDFTDGARLTEADLDKAYRQGLFAAQEVAEDAQGIGNLSTANLTLSGTTNVNKLHVTDSSNAEVKLQTDNANGGSVVKFNRSGTDNSYIGTKGYFIGNSDNNLYIRANSGLGIHFYTNGSNERMRIDTDGNLLVGRTNNPSGVSNCIYGLGNYGVTTSSGANVHINSEGLFFRSTSSQRYKNTINDATHGLTELLTLRPVTYKGNNDGDTVFGGLIAEEVHDAGLTEFVQYNDDGEPDELAYGNMVSLCIKAIQELKTELDEAKARITALEAQ